MAKKSKLEIKIEEKINELENMIIDTDVKLEYLNQEKEHFTIMYDKLVEQKKLLEGLLKKE